VENRRRGSRIS